MATSAVQHRTIEHEPSILTRWLLAAAAVGIIAAAALAIADGGSTTSGDGPAAAPASPSAAQPWGFSGGEAGAAGDVAGSTGQGWPAVPGIALDAWFSVEDLLVGYTGLVASVTGLDVAGTLGW